MYIKSLSLTNIGPFKSASLDFSVPSKENQSPPVTIITGVNGAGKSIVIDALRAAISGQPLERDIISNRDNFKIQLEANLGSGFHDYSTSSLNTINEGISKAISYTGHSNPFNGYKASEIPYDWVVDYWSSKIPSDSFVIENLKGINHYDLLNKALSGVKSNLALVTFICNIDYMRNSEVDSERLLGEKLFAIIVEIINNCLDNGHFAHVRRSQMMPVVVQNGYELSLEKLSSGNIFMIEHMLLLLCKMYSIAVLRGISPEKLLEIRGLLLIDEIENHLHPKWQKKILNIIRYFFPNLQIILTTHSPFILSALNDVRIYTCSPLAAGGSEIVDTTDDYNGVPVDEILLSEPFNETTPFSEKVTRLMAERKDAIRNKDMERAESLSKELVELNPDFFQFLDTEGISMK